MRDIKGRFVGHGQIEKICKNCGKIFKVPYCNRNRIKCCSLACSRNYRKGKRPNRDYSWTEKDIMFLKENFPILPYREIAKVLSKTPSAIAHKASKLKLNRRAIIKITPRICKGCGIEFKPDQNSISFHDKDCYEKWKKRNHICQNTGKTWFKKGQEPFNKGGWEKVMDSELFKTFREKNKKQSLNLWRSSSYQAKQMSSRNLKPNNFEKSFYDEMLNRLVNKGVIIYYVGNFKKFIGSRNPDFIMYDYRTCKLINKVIELFGDYYHGKHKNIVDKKFHEEERINYFRQHGYDCLVIWESEWKSHRNDVIQKVLQFCISD